MLRKKNRGVKKLENTKEHLMLMNRRVARVLVGLSMTLSLTSSVLATASLPRPLPEISDIRIQPITKLDWVEPYEGHLFHANTLWVGRNTDPVRRKFFRLEAYNGEGTKQLASLELKHSASFIYAFGDNQVIVVGKTYIQGDGWYTGYTVASTSSAGVVTLQRVVMLPTHVMVDQFVGNPSQMYFTEPGSRAIYEWRSGRFSTAASEISNPGKSLLVGSTLYSIERNNVGPGDENMVRINLQTNNVDRLLTNMAFNNLSNMIYLKGVHKIAGSITWGGSVAIIDPNNWSIDGVEEVVLGGDPRGLAQLGHCLAVLSLPPNTNLKFIDLSTTPKQVIGTWDLSALGDDFLNPRHLEVDPAKGRFYIRSAYASDLPDHDYDGVAMVEETSQEMLKTCTR
jgi:hypothetical protein